ncbi:MAG: isoprenylcysteine carboxylmethyltransferase family protein [Ignavibacteria bacterium]|nr:isoprenylcysteine carboxylmethyltransferase family protein [Ignavibacteria bacterium]MBT8382085.1 isoprenylcysteine carboxylmethyltransferase family protein [Ignavibacteria bacterium]MBT8390221.1 isoprenylcysteine carboxylmethyltransferase family protein [Ignavibacteria bacterium]NNJ52826.1 isoprenylcysteine carboxylmethyltransferase family protein [Ignavibacteriaceae bacterium]NNL20874.1 isoprenylcysteine carboxylmethyltransferase family protein [Ignavibacteriaceae bacterium]
MQNLSSILFKYRSYSPIPFLILMLAFHNANLWSMAIGFVIALTGEAIRLWAVSWTGSETRTTGEAGGTFLIISGPFAYVRNPLYIGNILLYLGLGIMSFALFPYLQIIAVCFFLWQYHSIIKYEEIYLQKTFGEEYENYLKNVRSIIPRFTPYKNSSLEQPLFNLKAGLRSEKRSIQAFISVALAIVIIWFIKVYNL